jgi:arsenite methyltransferase
MNADNIRKAVRDKYASVVINRTSCCGPSSSCCGPTAGASAAIGYSAEDLKNIPDDADLGLGCGNPVALASLTVGETVVDLGSGAGIDCFLAAKKVGERGRVIGVDMTPEMLERARENARKSGLANVEFRLGEIENLPVADATVDVVISNCVINLSPDKERVFREVHRVLKPGGRMMVSDIVLERELPEEIARSVAAYTGCIAGASLKSDYLGMRRGRPIRRRRNS